jgi:hypothetical protein
MNKLAYSTILCAMWGAIGCASLQSVSVTNIPRERGKPVTATADNVAFLGLHFSNDFADGLQDDLRSQCPDGKVTGIYSKYESKWYVLVQNRSVTASGYCVPGDAPSPELVKASPALSEPPVAPAPTPEPAPAEAPAEEQP